MNIELSSVALQLINDLYRTGLYGDSMENVARRLVEEQLQRLVREGVIGERLKIEVGES